MTLKKLLLLFISTVGILILSANSAFATTYNYVGSNFTYVTGPPYTTNMNVTGSITTSSPIPANTTLALPNNPLVTSWTFNDGVQTIDSNNGQFFPGYTSEITTDATGAISNFHLQLVTTPFPTAVNETTNVILISDGTFANSLDGGFQNVTCTTIAGSICKFNFTLGPYGATDDPLNPGQGQVAFGVWSIGNNSPVNVPSLSTWGILLLILSLLFLSQTRMGLFAKVKSKK